MNTDWGWIAWAIFVGSTAGAVALSVVANLLTPFVAKYIATRGGLLKKTLKATALRELRQAERLASESLYRDVFIGEAILAIMRNFFLVTIILITIGVWISARDTTDLDRFLGNIVSSGMLAFAAIPLLFAFLRASDSAEALKKASNIEKAREAFTANYGEQS